MNREQWRIPSAESPGSLWKFFKLQPVQRMCSLLASVDGFRPTVLPIAVWLRVD
jgi:hypothetical protein